MIDWKEVSRDYRARFRAAMRTIDQRTRLAAAEHEKRILLVAAMSDLLPRMALYGEWCRVCDSKWAEGHREGCRYLRALSAVNDAARSVNVA